MKYLKKWRYWKYVEVPLGLLFAALLVVFISHNIRVLDSMQSTPTPSGATPLPLPLDQKSNDSKKVWDVKAYCPESTKVKMVTVESPNQPFPIMRRDPMDAEKWQWVVLNEVVASCKEGVIAVVSIVEVTATPTP